jgi:hypothetical protein
VFVGVEKNVIFGPPETPTDKEGNFYMAFHLKDSTSEIKQMRGTQYTRLFRREVLTKSDGSSLHPLDLLPGCRVDLLDKSFYVTDSDQRTKSYWKRVYGIDVTVNPSN